MTIQNTEAQGKAPAMGHNAPPDPFTMAQDEITTLYEEAKQYLDGEPIHSEGMADDVSNLLAMARNAKKRADEARVAEKKPHDDAAKAVQAKYKPLLEQADRTADACKAALAPWLEKLDAEKRAREESARREAEEATRAAQAAMRARDITNLAEREAADRLAEDAKRAERAASAASRDKAKAGGMLGRSASLRTVREVEVTDGRELLRHCYAKHYADLLTLATKLAEQDVRAGATEIPGVIIHEKKVAV